MKAWDKVSRFSGGDESVFKYVFERSDAVAEAVLYRYPTFEERTVLCCSTQSGCPVGCTFCGTGRRFVRNLSMNEILAQVYQAFGDHRIDHTKVKKLQIMFMSMGEPMLNFPNVSDSIRILHEMYPRADLLLSTMAPDLDYSELLALSKEISKVGLQFSVHESKDETRDKLIPFKKKLPLAKLARVGEAWAQVTGRRPFFNYCAHSGNTSDTDVVRLLEHFEPLIWEATVSVICEKDETIKAAHARQLEMTAKFQRMLVQVGYSVRTFNPAGQDDIGGGCGQLWYTQKWLKEHGR